MSVFIGYQHADHPHALRVRKQLRRAGIEVRMDVMDFESLTTLHVTETITAHIRDCTHVILMMSHSSARRWWIPFSIGEATSWDRRICVYRMGDQALPEYLAHWPTLTRTQQLDFVIEAYHREAALRMPTSQHETPLHVRARDIHRGLRERIGRGF
ncbi:toll/interleukin-1 receptor domain-containing protein [Pseudomonas sp. CFBP 8770]|uniref:toll/interleukin-1 receptor domain-containing protein n=1 Tax=unclassified Pseudomonas TaxID=196821 RepID=UPI001781B1AC|nr:MULTISPECIES: toll/interleukin-1 receptor domain-containing protein [unclassified Pseudomonas]MBD8473986.1 toll/interleukin-1 receptor domain-containing protein [Pseudomonas sp. CFBP 8773]MBD8647115.1 toll/interleukin-1 receptor domain-containing protein [Pseudomonas sp. CFBP 8770]